MSMKFEVVGATKYDFTDDKSGRRVQGVNAYYLNEASGDNAVGKIPAKVSLPIETWASVSRLYFPVVCEAETEQILGPKGIITKVIGLKPVSQLEKK